jgi:hypothetical protein
MIKNLIIPGITQGHDVQLKNVWGHVNFVARGEGQALAQLGRNIVDLVLN